VRSSSLGLQPAFERQLTSPSARSAAAAVLSTRASACRADHVVYDGIDEQKGVMEVALDGLLREPARLRPNAASLSARRQAALAQQSHAFGLGDKRDLHLTDRPARHVNRRSCGISLRCIPFASSAATIASASAVSTTTSTSRVGVIAHRHR
jgi:hypothetical protein